MATGPSKYDHYAETIIHAERASGVLVIVVNGRNGHGIACKSAGATPADAAHNQQLWPALLRKLAADMEAEQGKPS